MDAELHLEGDFRKTEKKVTWVADLPALTASNEGPIPLVLMDFDYLITTPKLEEGGDFMAAINPVTKIESRGLGEPAMRTLQAGAIVQVERKGYYRVDKPYMSEDRPMILFAIPDGRQRSWGVGSAKAPAAPTPAPAAAKEKGAKKGAVGAGAGEAAAK